MILPYIWTLFPHDRILRCLEWKILSILTNIKRDKLEIHRVTQATIILSDSKHYHTIFNKSTRTGKFVGKPSSIEFLSTL